MGLYLCFVLLDPIPTPIRTPNALYNYLQPLPSPFSPLPQGTKAPRVQQLSFPTWRQISVHRTCGTCAQSMVCAISEPTPQGRAQKCRRAGRSAAATLHNGAVPTSLYIVVTQKLSCKWQAWATPQARVALRLWQSWAVTRVDKNHLLVAPLI